MENSAQTQTNSRKIPDSLKYWWNFHKIHIELVYNKYQLTKCNGMSFHTLSLSHYERNFKVLQTKLQHAFFFGDGNWTAANRNEFHHRYILLPCIYFCSFNWNWMWHLLVLFVALNLVIICPSISVWYWKQFYAECYIKWNEIYGKNMWFVCFVCIVYVWLWQKMKLNPQYSHKEWQT